VLFGVVHGGCFGAGGGITGVGTLGIPDCGILNAVGGTYIEGFAPAVGGADIVRKKLYTYRVMLIYFT
jgi:hypothetical protein